MTENIYTLPTLCGSRISISKTKARNIQNVQNQYIHIEEEGDILIYTTGGVSNGTITIRAWQIFEYKNNKHWLLGYQDKVKEKCTPLIILWQKRGFKKDIFLSSSWWIMPPCWMIQMKHNPYLSIFVWWNIGQQLI